MIKIVNKIDCCGCYSCYNICPKSCIAMEKDDKGFFYPSIDLSQCINCNLCESVCPIKKTVADDGIILGSYAVKNKSDDERMCSSSGAFFSAISHYVFSKNGVVFGTKMSSDNKFATLCEATNVNELKALRGSKYIQSRIDFGYRQIRNRLNDGKLVLVVGTPCQIEGLLNFLNKDYDNLITIDLFCHGVPSEKVWQKYISYYEDIEKSNVELVNFRCKENGWANFGVNICFENKKNIFHRFSDDIFGQIFLSDLPFRSSCTKCRFKKIHRLADFTIGDFWGIEGVAPEFNDDKGVSLVIVQSKKATYYLNEIKNDFYLINVDFEKAIKYNPYYCKSLKLNSKSNDFFSRLDLDELPELAKQYAILKPSFKNRFLLFCDKFSILRFFKKIIKKFFH